MVDPHIGRDLPPCDMLRRSLSWMCYNLLLRPRSVDRGQTALCGHCDFGSGPTGRDLTLLCCHSGPGPGGVLVERATPAGSDTALAITVTQTRVRRVDSLHPMHGRKVGCGAHAWASDVLHDVRRAGPPRTLVPATRTNAGTPSCNSEWIHRHVCDFSSWH
jgi:hypothetical protein